MATEIASFRVLAPINEERNAYGLRSSDYARYHKHCSQKLHGLRQKTKLTHGKGREYKHTAPVPVESLTTSHLQLTLFEAERAWAHSQEISHTKDSDDDAKLRRRITSRFRRALTHSSLLVTQALSLYPTRISALSLIEILVYHHSISGRFLLRRDEFEPSIQHLTLAKSLLAILQKQSSNTSRDQALYALYGDEIAPQIRFAAHSLGRKQAYDIDGVVNEYLTKEVKASTLFKRMEAEATVDSEEGEAGPARAFTNDSAGVTFDALIAALTAESQKAKGAGALGRSLLKEVVWEGKPVPIRNPELVDAFLRVQAAEEGLITGAPVATAKSAKAKGGKEKVIPIDGVPETLESIAKAKRGKIAAYDSVLLAWSDAELVARQLAESQSLTSQTASSSQGSPNDNRDIHFVLAYTTYKRLSRHVERDLLLVNSLLPSSTGTSSALRTRAIPKALVKQRERRAEKERRIARATGATASVHKASSSSRAEEKEDPRINPGLVKLYDTILQGLEQMRNLSIVDESVDLVPSVESRLAYAKAKRVLYLARTYATLKQFAEALALSSKAHIYLREASSFLSSYDPSSPSAAAEELYYPLTATDIASTSAELEKEENKIKGDWFNLNGGAASGSSAGKKKPTFYDVAFNYIELPMDHLIAKSTKAPPPTQPSHQKAQAPTKAPAPVSATEKQSVATPPAAATSKRERRATKVEEAPPAPEIKITETGGWGVGGILGGWWGRK